MATLTLLVNGAARTAEADPDTPLRSATLLEVPAMAFDLIQRLDQPPLGVGEPASAAVPAALANAVFDATGVRLRTVPFRPERVKAALDARQP
jgi:CO/xanthine dehydrogenase Mo-binding subunit